MRAYIIICFFNRKTATSDANKFRLLYICLVTGHGESQKWGSLFFSAFSISLTIDDSNNSGGIVTLAP